jgi:type II secretory ATPase GspE/PulE/Tfp pilus assembly ATPase PilB-like protein
MGVEDYLLASSLIGVLAQRLVRVVCSDCKVRESVPAAGLRDAGFSAGEKGAFVEISRGKGCEHCDHTGYASRLGIFELLEIGEDLRKLMLTRSDSNALKSEAVRSGMRTLRDDGWIKVMEGLTTPDEVLRVTQEV